MAPSVVVVADSSASLPEPVARHPLVRVVPIRLHLAGGELRGDDPTAAQMVYGALVRGEAVKSSAPSAADYLGAIEDAGTRSALVVVPALEFTDMARNAALAASLANVPVEVVDCRTAAAAQGLVVAAAAEEAARGADLAEVRRCAEDAARRAELVAALDSLTVLRASGHVPPGTLGLSDRVGARSVFRVSDGAVERLGTSRSGSGAVGRILQEGDRFGLGQAERRVVFHAEGAAAARELAGRLGGVDTIVEFSPSIGIHTGPGVVGVAWLRPEAA